MQQTIIKKESEKRKMKEIFWIILFIIFFVVFIFFGYMRVRTYGEINLKIIINILTVVFFFYIFIYLDTLLKRKYYTSKVYSSRLIAGGYTFLTLIFPKGCFIKENFWKGYFIYLLSRIFLIAFIYLIIKLIATNCL